MTDNSLMPYGLYKGLLLKDIPMDYLLDEWDAGNLNTELRQYVASKLPIMANVLDKISAK